MTRKDYQKFAEMFAQVRVDRSENAGGMLNLEELKTIEHIEVEVMNLFSAENPLFDEVKFVLAISEHFHKISKY
jgi:hypothetical protein